VAGDLTHPRGRRGWCDKTNEGQIALAQPGLALRIRSHWQIRYEYAVDSRIGGTAEALVASGEEGIQISEQDHWNTQAGRRNQLERPIERHARRKSLLRALLNHWTVGDRVGKRNSYLDYVSSFRL
jgi:hypothetical protein